MNKKTVMRTIVATIGILVLRQVLKSAEELRRYDHVRSMSNEGPVLAETPEVLMEVMAQERHFFTNLGSFFKSVPKDALRYLKIESM